MFLEDVKVIENIQIADNYYLMRVEGDKINGLHSRNMG